MSRTIFHANRTIRMKTLATPRIISSAVLRCRQNFSIEPRPSRQVLFAATGEGVRGDIFEQGAREYAFENNRDGDDCLYFNRSRLGRLPATKNKTHYDDRCTRVSVLRNLVFRSLRSKHAGQVSGSEKHSLGGRHEKRVASQSAFSV
jgi:hypothetical protein